MMNRDEVAIAKSVIYASLFDYPLTLSQLRDTLIGSTLSSEQILATYEGSARLKSIIADRDGFFFPVGRDDLVPERVRREARSRQFLRHHARLLRWLCALPFTRMIALSGSIAHLNLEAGGDLDLFIVTRGRTVWTVTVAVILLTRLLGVRRLVCANFVMSDEHLAIEQQDLFTANQVLHLKPICGSEVLDGFVAANPFVQRFYPNRPRTAPRGFLVPLGHGLTTLKRSVELLLALPAPFLESACQRAYGRHLRRRARAWPSPEQVRLRPDYLKLHTHSHRRSVLERFEERVEEALGQGERAAIA